MRKPLARLFVLIVIAAASLYVAPPTEAQPKDWIYIVYYDCDWNVVGEAWRDCSGYWNYSGAQSGEYRETTSDACTPGDELPVSVIHQRNQGVWEPWTGESPYCHCIRIGAC